MAVSRLGAMQAQDYPGALWSIGLRLAGVTRAHVERAIEDRTIVRTWPMRGTLHLVPASDVRWMLRLLTPRVISRTAARYRQLGLTDADFVRGRDLVTEALDGGRVLTRGELFEAIEQGGLAPTGQRGAHILSRLSMDAVLCFGPPRGKQPTFVLLDEWIPAGHELDRQEALRTIVERYFCSHGPATVQDFAGWAGLTVTDTRAGIALAADALRSITVDGREYWLAADTAVPPPDAGPAGAQAFLLPGFDEYMLGYKDRSAALRPEHAGRICPGGNGVFYPTLVLGGQVRGTWKAVTRAGSIRIDATPFQPLDAAQQLAFEAPASAYERFTGVPVTLAWPSAPR